jgi:hypothetical protein
MNARTRFCIALATLSTTGSVLKGQSGGGFDLTWSTIDGGGAMNSAGGSFDLSGTVGQPDTQSPPVMTGGSFELTGGFWPAASVCFCLSDMNTDGRKDGADAQKFVNCILLGGDCSCADVDQANGVEFGDVSAFVDDLLDGPNCP